MLLKSEIHPSFHPLDLKINLSNHTEFCFMSNTISFSHFRPNKSADDTEAFAAAMSYLQNHPGTTLIVEPGVYVITSDLARRTQAAVMRGDYGQNPQPIMFHPQFDYTKGICFAGQKNTKLIGYGATILVDGFMEPISLTDCENIELCGITIDHKRKPFSRGTVTQVTPLQDGISEIIITMDEDCPVEKGTPLSLREHFYDIQQNQHLHSIGAGKREVLDSLHVKMFVSGPVKKGLLWHTIHTYHSRPAVLIENAKDITLTDVTLHSQPGMGIVGNRSENITLRRLAVVPACGYHYSVNTDATHFTSIKGKIRIENCLFDSQGDDFTNIHNYYQAIIRRENNNICYIQEQTPDGTHAQSLDYPDVGDTLELTDKNTLQTVDQYTVVDCVPLPEKWMCKITLDHDLPDTTENLVLSDITRLPFVEITGCTARSHFARGVLLKTRGAVVENNYFLDIFGTAIQIAAEAVWSEGVCPADITIRHNLISNCGCDGWDVGGICVKADSPQSRGQSIFHITIEDNIIDTPRSRCGIFVRNTCGLKMYRNRILAAETPVEIIDCTQVDCDCISSEQQIP